MWIISADGGTLWMYPEIISDIIDLDDGEWIYDYQYYGFIQIKAQEDYIMERVVKFND